MARTKKAATKTTVKTASISETPAKICSNRIRRESQLRLRHRRQTMQKLL